MRKIHLSVVSGLLSLCLLCGCSQTEQPGSSPTQSTSNTTNTNAVELISDTPTTQYFTDAAVLQQISDGMSGGMGFGGTMPPNGTAMPGGSLPENMTLPEEMERPEGMTPPEGVELPGGKTPPEGMELPEGMTPPEGMERPEGMNPPAGFAGGSGSGAAAKAGLTDAPLAIVVSCTEGSELDAGLACQNMSVTAQLLGYGTKIISSPTIALNGEKQDEYRELLGIPETHSAVAVLLIGYADTSIDETMDAYTGATTRNPMDELVTYVSAK